MRDIVIIVKDESSAEKLYSLSKILFPESEIHVLIKNDIKKVLKTCEKSEPTSRTGGMRKTPKRGH